MQSSVCSVLQHFIWHFQTLKPAIIPYFSSTSHLHIWSLWKQEEGIRICFRKIFLWKPVYQDPLILFHAMRKYYLDKKRFICQKLTRKSGWNIFWIWIATKWFLTQCYQMLQPNAYIIFSRTGEVVWILVFNTWTLTLSNSWTIVNFWKEFPIRLIGWATENKSLLMLTEKSDWSMDMISNEKTDYAYHSCILHRQIVPFYRILWKWSFGDHEAFSFNSGNYN